MNTPTPPLITVLVLPGWQNSGPAHWQSRWEALQIAPFEFVRVQQSDWMRPLRGDWMIQLEEAVLAAPGPVLLAAHSMGCMLTAAWAAHSQNTHRVAGALLVAPGDPEREELRAVLKSWSPIVRKALPFKSILLGSENDPYCDFARAQGFAQSWGSQFVNYGVRGHINAESGLGDWPDGLTLLQRLCDGQLNRGSHEGARKAGLSAHAFMVKTLADATERARLRQQFDQDTADAWNEAENTGLSHSLEEVRQYFAAKATWRRGEGPQPEPLVPTREE